VHYILILLKRSKDLVGSNSDLMMQVLYEVVYYKKDCVFGVYFAEKFGNKYIELIKDSNKQFYCKDYEEIKDNIQERIQNMEIEPSGFFNCDELNDSDIIFVDSVERFKQMIENLAAYENLDTIGLDCNFTRFVCPLFNKNRSCIFI
jgi:hypothetical protein